MSTERANVVTRDAEAAKADWEQRIGRRSGEAEQRAAVSLSAPRGLGAVPGRAQVTLDWEPVEGASGYLVHRATADEGPYGVVDFGGNDVLAVPHPPFTDTTGTSGEQAWYAVAAVADVGTIGPLSEPVAAASAVEGAAVVTVDVDASTVTGSVRRPWRQMVGSEHLSLMLSRDTCGGRPIGDELRAALRECRERLGVDTVRAHAILGDDLGVYREEGGRPVHDFSGVDRVYDTLLDIGLRPVVELSFMPRDLASDPDATVFAYEAIISPPKDYERWADLVRELVAHLVERYGLEEVRDRWSFEVWNEANLEVFWSGTPEEYFRLYDVTARAVKDVHPDLWVGGPSSAAAGWVEELLAHIDESGAPLDFVSTHTYGSPPLDLRPILARHDRKDAAIWWTEWGSTPTHFNQVADEAFVATFVLRGMRSAAGRIESLSHWVASDHFEELGRPPALFHGGFGLMTVGNLHKPRFRALELLERLGEEELPAAVDGDGAGGMVEAWAARHPDGRVGVLVWNGTLDQSKAAGDSALDRSVRLRVDGLAQSSYRLRHLRVDSSHSNIAAVWKAMSGGADWPAGAQWHELGEADVLDELEPERELAAVQGTVQLDFDLPMPGISLLEFDPH